MSPRLYTTPGISDPYGRTLPPARPLVKAQGIFGLERRGLRGGAVSEPGLPVLLGGVLGRGLVDVDPPDPVGPVRGGADLDVPVVVVGDGRPLPREDLGGQVRGGVERHLERGITQLGGQGPEDAAE